MKVLAWDSSSKVGSIAGVEFACDSFQGQTLFADFKLSVDTQHSEQLLWGIHQVLKALNWSLRDLDLLVVGRGPGSFTGLRIGLSTARSLAQVLNKPLVGVSSLEALLFPYCEADYISPLASSGDVLFFASTDACKGDLFCRFFYSQTNVSKTFPKVVQDILLTPDLALAFILNIAQQTQSLRCFAIGEASSRYPEIAEKLKEKGVSYHCLSPEIAPQGRALAQLGQLAFQRGEAVSPFELLPQYLRLSEAENRLLAKKTSAQRALSPSASS